MNKYRIFLPSFFLLIFFLAFCATSIKADTPAAIPTSGPAPSSSSTNPGPPLGTPCGNTICLPNEICTSYPGDSFQHCVPNPINEKLPSFCGVNNSTFPPNNACWNDFTNTQTDLTLYKKTCIYEPVVTYSDKRKLNAGIQSFSKCGIGDSGPGGPPAPGGGDAICDVHMLANTDVRFAELGGYGPDQTTIDTKSVDFISQNYLYDALFDRPSNLTDNKPEDLAQGIINNPDKNKEAYRTYWRLMPAINQANLRSFTMNMADQKLITNTSFKYIDNVGTPRDTSFTKLYGALKTQVILFFHFPFIRIGCLASYPVCPEYAQAQKELRPDFALLRSFADILGIRSAVDQYISIYEGAISVFDLDLRAPYDAFVPLNFDSARGYIVKKKTGDESDAANDHPELKNDLVRGLIDVSLSNVSRENLPYIEAVYQGLLSPKFGMIPALESQWIIDRYATPGADIISDYKMGNAATTSPEIKIEQKGLLETIQEEAAQALSDPFGWVLGKLSSAVSSIFTPTDALKKGYTALKKDNENGAIIPQYVDMKGCPLPVSYHLLSPKTVPLSPDDHHQIVTIPGNQLQWSYTPSCHSMEPEEKCDKFGVCRMVIPHCSVSAETYIDPGSGDCCTRAWSVSGSKHGKALMVLNNPKQTDIKKAVASEPKIALYDMLLPDGAPKIPNAEIDAPIAKNTKTQGDALVTAPDGGGDVTNPAESIMRENNRAQDSIHYLQNCWTIPKDLQNSPRCKNALAQEASSSACTGELFAKLFPNPDAPSSKGTDYFNTYVKPNLTPEDIAAYTAAEQAKGIPCEVFAGIHFEEGDNNPNSSLQDGSPLNGKTLTQSAMEAGDELLSKAGGSIKDLNALIAALSDYNGGGNRNCHENADCPYTSDDRCGATVACSSDIASCSCPNPIPEPGSCRDKCGGIFAWKYDYSYCPPATPGYDDPYVTNWWKSPEHDNMYLLYMRDCTQTKPQLHTRPGSLTVAIALFLSEKSP